MGLNEFGQNLGARALYDDLGYRAVATTFSRDLLPVHASGSLPQAMTSPRTSHVSG
jgi:hypothetical protein